MADVDIRCFNDRPRTKLQRIYRQRLCKVSTLIYTFSESPAVLKITISKDYFSFLFSFKLSDGVHCSTWLFRAIKVRMKVQYCLLARLQRIRNAKCDYQNFCSSCSSLLTFSCESCRLWRWRRRWCNMPFDKLISSCKWLRSVPKVNCGIIACNWRTIQLTGSQADH